jgi:hypothetical protein
MSEMYDNKQRRAYFKKDNNLEDALGELNDLISRVHIPKVYNAPKIPILLLMGCPRAGSTVFLQWIASLGIFTYPTNLIARFYKNPYIGILAQQSLLEYDRLNQLGFKSTTIEYSSNLGKTIGALSPSEYWYFWREFFNFGEINILSEEELKKVDSKKFLDQISAFENLTNKPLAMKGMLLNWHIPYLYSINNNFIFVDIKRDYFFNAQSLLYAREKFFGSRKKWYSFKPKEYEFLKDKNEIEQVAGQVVYTRKAVEKGLESVPLKNKITIDYSDFCKSPQFVLNQIKAKYNEFGVDINTECIDKVLLKPFKESNTFKLSDLDVCALNKELSKFTL